MITNDFQLDYFGYEREETLSWTYSTPSGLTVLKMTFYENGEVIAGTHPVLDDEGKQNLVMGVARLRDGRIYRYDHGE